MKTGEKILRFLENDARLTPAQIAVMLNKEEGDIRALIEDYEKDGVIVGYRTMVDWDKTDREYVSALIELKLLPQKDRGFDSVAERICNYDEVKSVYLMSGGFDLAVFIEGKSLRSVAQFVSERLSTLDCVLSTATHETVHRGIYGRRVYVRSRTDRRIIPATAVCSSSDGRSPNTRNAGSG